MGCFLAWIRLDDQIAHHPKFLEVGPSASWLWVCCIGYAQKFLTDGFIPAGALSSLSSVRDAEAQVKKLASVHLLDVVDGGYMVHDYLEHNASAAEVKADREWDRVRKQLYSSPELVLAIKQRDQNRCRYCSVKVNWSDRRGPVGGQFDHVEPRGPNTIENLVVACRRCNARKNNRLIESVGMVLLPIPSSKSVQNQNEPSSEPVLRARARSPIPSHPIQIEEVVVEKHAKSEKPVFQGQRFVVFEWMQLNLEAVLGSELDIFQLGDWFRTLDKSIAGNGATDTDWPWLRKQLIREIRKRGLPLDSENVIRQREKEKPRSLEQTWRTQFEFVCPHEPKCSGRNACDVKQRLGK